ncbi:MAG: hypothetical protein GY861_19605 [bacterium]|nr:hypothetical protein [bacterium]
MAVVIALPQLEVTFREVLVIQYLYRVMHYYLIEEGWTDLKGDDYASKETLYLERKGTNKGPNERELRIWWRLMRKTGNPYYTYYMDVDINVIQITDMELMHKGKKIKVQHCELKVTINTRVELPEWGTSPILKLIDNFYRMRLLRKNLDEHKKEIYREAYKFQGMIKKYLELKDFTPEVELFQEKFEAY